MDRGSYASASGGFRQLRSLDITANNLANISTAGYKRQILVSSTQRFEDTFASLLESSDPYAKLDHERTPGSTNLRTMTDFSPGPITSTGNPFDVALSEPNQFFVVQGRSGEQLYTRAGNFTLNDQGILTTQDGLPLVGDGGPITANGSVVTISANGSVLSDGQPAGQLQIVAMEDSSNLERVDGTRFKTANPQSGQPIPVDNPEVIPGSLEMSNVSTIDGVIELVSAHRGFEMYTKIAQSIDELNQTAISRVGSRR
jgi:flagellar basal-body rod protein FlgF